MATDGSETDVDVGAETIHVRLDGRRGDPAVLLLHGFLGSYHWFDRLVPLLPGVRVIRPDLAGHGASTDQGGGRSPEQQARLIARALEAIGETPVVTVGHSLGATIAIALAEQGAPVGDLVLLDEGPDYSLAHSPRVNAVLRFPVIGRFLWDHLPDSAVLGGVSGFFAPDVDVPGLFTDRGQPLADARRVSHATFVGTQEGKEHYAAVRPLDVRLAALDACALVLFGGADGIFDVEPSLARYTATAGADVAVIAGSGHAPMLEAPAATASHVVAFLHTRVQGS
jgi:pimeloyl-ACP methyl ester carboxylesterase